MEFPVIQRIGTAIRTQRVAREYGIEALSRVLQEYLPEDQIADVRRAYEFGARMHSGQARQSGEPYIYHPLAVARILAEMRLDVTTLCAAILHDVIEDTAVDKSEIARQFGLSQPTVSAHVQLLREAGLLEEKTVGRSAQLSASQEGLHKMFANAEESLIRAFRA